MARYRVKALSVGGHSNKVFHSGDIVTDANFFDAAEKVKEGFLELIEEPAAAVEPPVHPFVPPTPPVVDGPDGGGDVSRGTSEPEKGNGDAGDQSPDQNQPEPAAAVEPPVPEPFVLMPIEEMKVRDMKKILTERGVEFSNTDDKEALYEKLKSISQ